MARPLPFRAARAPATASHQGFMTVEARWRSMGHAGRSRAACGDRGDVCGCLGAYGVKALLGKARRYMLVLHAGAASGCSAVPPCSARSSPP